MNKIVKIIFVFAMCLFLSGLLDAQSITWQRIYGLHDDRTGTCGIQTFDGGYLFISSYPGTKITKVDPYGLIEWEKFYQVGAQDKVIQTKDSGYVMCGTGGNIQLGGILKIKNNGDSVWYKEYGTATEFRLLSIIEYNDGGFISCGYKNQYAYLIRVDSSGNRIWENQFIDTYAQEYQALDLLLDANLNIVVTGNSRNISISPERIDVLLYKLNPNGNDYLKKYISTEPKNEAGKIILRSYDGKYIISGEAFNYNLNPVCNSHITKLDTNGNVIFQKYYYDKTYYIAKTSDSNGYVLAGLKYVDVNEFPKYCFLKVNLDGDEIFTRILDNSPIFTLPQDMKLVKDGGYFCTGYYYDSTLQIYSTYVVKTDSSCNAADPVNITNTVKLIPDDFSLSPAYPNPFNPFTTLKYNIRKNDIYQLEIFNTQGKKEVTVFNKYIQTGTYSIKLEKEFLNLPSSIYFIRLSSGNDFKIQKLVLLK